MRFDLRAARDGMGLQVRLAHGVRRVGLQVRLARQAFSRALRPCACRAFLPARLPRPFPCVPWLEYHGCAVLRATPGGIFDEEVTPMDAQTVIALCAIFTVVAAMIGLSKGK